MSVEPNLNIHLICMTYAPFSYEAYVVTVRVRESISQRENLAALELQPFVSPEYLSRLSMRYNSRNRTTSPDTLP